MTDPQEPRDAQRRSIDDDEPQFHIVDEGDEAHEPDEPPVGREVYEESTEES